MSDRIVLQNIRVEGRHGVADAERANAQPFEVDIELHRDLRPAGMTDDLARTVDYAAVDGIVRAIVGTESHHLLETIAERISASILAVFDVDEVVVRVRKPAVALGGPVDFSGVEIHRRPGARSD
jgi:7,8-dihydroneopterin aldolase/epimerase/oxygenase